eukprot:TRINITY_DN14660_c0_g1_i2.p1 TRINITY_DN14660_c0_g1~~TRINITY_DN14660_c0_g1_i2.p1  ORF type:complete len:400 (+),score=71.97 TRINITY_DN14660_c0_g1_i2:61-1200(+)
MDLVNLDIENERTAAVEIQTSELTVAEEVHRAARVGNLRTALQRECKKENKPVPLLVYERWQGRSYLVDQSDPLLPGEDEGLLKDLVRGELQQAPKIAKYITKQALKAREAVKDTVAKEDLTIWVNNNKTNQVDVHAGSRREYHTINRSHYDKLWLLFKSASDSDDQAAFHEKLFLILQRYASLGGHGYQAALPASAFTVIHNELKVDCECFASPLNCRYKRYYSAFPDTDCCFGSLGSFFKDLPKSGSYEANPPFVPEIMTSCVEHIEKCLQNSDQPLSFFIVIPTWKEVRSWNIANKSAYLKLTFDIPASQHTFFDGAQHIRRSLHRQSSYASSIFILQNDAGAEKYPVAENLQNLFESGMKQGLDTGVSRRNVVYV